MLRDLYPHHDIRIIQRSSRQSAVASAVYQTFVYYCLSSNSGVLGQADNRRSHRPRLLFYFQTNQYQKKGRFQKGCFADRRAISRRRITKASRRSSDVRVCWLNLAFRANFSS